MVYGRYHSNVVYVCVLQSSYYVMSDTCKETGRHHSLSRHGKGYLLISQCISLEYWRG